MEPGADGYNLSQPIIFRHHLSAAPAILWLQNIVPPLIAGVSLFAFTRFYHVKFGDEFVVLTVLVTALSLTLLPARSATYDLLNGRLPLVVRLITRWAVLLGVLLALGYATKFSAEYSRRVILTWALVTPALLVLIMLSLQELTRRLLAEPVNSRRAIFVGCNDTSVILGGRLANHNELGISVAGFFDDRDCERLDTDQRLRLLGKFAEVVEYVKARGIDVIFVAMPLRNDARVRRLLDELGDTTASIYYVPDVLGFELIQARTSEILGVPVVAMCETPFYGYRGVVKRLMDVAIAAGLLLLAAPLMIVIALLVSRTTSGSVIFKQRRYGLDGREFSVYKFRTMTVSEDGGRIPQATRDDPRVTPLGRWLRRYSLDELPQLINVLQGRMNLVGPRPHAVAHNEECRKLIKRYMVRHKVLPGITGLAQVSGCRGETARLEEMQARVALDLEYLRNWSPLLDLQILLLTVFEVVRSDRAY